MKPIKQKNGYQNVNLYDDEGKPHTERLHKVVYCAVNGLWNIPEGYELHHLDENKMNNKISNILLCSHQENCNHGTRNERIAKALSKALKGKIPAANPPKKVAAYNEAGELMMVFESTMEAGRNGYNHGNVSACCRNCFNRVGNNKYKGFIWKYLDEESEAN